MPLLLVKMLSVFCFGCEGNGAEEEARGIIPCSKKGALVREVGRALIEVGLKE